MELMESGFYYPHTGDRSSRRDWEREGSLDMRARARRRAMEILENHQPRRIDDAVDGDIRRRFDILLSPGWRG
jgi:trimethylamine--corrinoid protein Co-methyltransferase